MITTTCIKYYGMGKYYDPLAAGKELAQLQEKHPDREYVIVMNMRSSVPRRYQVAQVKTIKLDWPEPEDLGLGPEPKRPIGASTQAWEDYHHELRELSKVVDKHTAPLKKALNEKLNP